MTKQRCRFLQIGTSQMKVPTGLHPDFHRPNKPASPPKTAKPFHLTARGRRAAATPGMIPSSNFNPNGVASGGGIWHGYNAMPQSLSNLLIHLVFSTAGREPYLTNPELRREMHNYLGGIVNGKGGHSIAVGGVDDHVHLLFTLPRTMTLADMVRDIKRASSLWVKKRDSSLKTFAWQGGYGAFSAGQSETGIITDYIANQEEHHRNRTFQDEFLAFLEKYKIDYDERFVWE